MIQELRREHDLAMLLEIAQLPKATFYYHRKDQDKQDKYAQAKAEITAIFHENKGRYGYRRVTDELHNRGFNLNHKTVQRLMKELGLICRVRKGLVKLKHIYKMMLYTRGFLGGYLSRSEVEVLIHLARIG